MKSPRLVLLFRLGLGLLTVGSFSPTAHARGKSYPPYSSEAGRIRWQERNRQFARLWLSRAANPDDAARKILPFALEQVDENADLRERAIIALGRIESPVAQKPLEDLLNSNAPSVQKPEDPWVNPKEISRRSLQFAIARIQTRDMKGEEKLDFVARAVGTTWQAVRQQGRDWKERLNNPKKHMSVYDYNIGHNSPRLMLEEFAQLLHDMGQKGEDVKALGAEDLLVRPEKSMLDNATQSVILTSNMTQSEAIDFWLQRALQPQSNVTPRAGSLSPQAFVDLGPPASKALKVALQDLLVRTKRDPSVVEGMRAVGPRTMFEAAAATGDADFIPILQSFVTLNAHETGSYAKRALDDLKSGEGVTSLPRLKLYFGPFG